MFTLNRSTSVTWDLQDPVLLDFFCLLLHYISESRSSWSTFHNALVRELLGGVLPAPQRRTNSESEYTCDVLLQGLSNFDRVRRYRVRILAF